MADKKPPETRIFAEGYSRRGFGMDGAMKGVSQIKERPPAPAPMRPAAATQMPVQTKGGTSEKK